jgi:predicted nucleic-acid-binding protein
METLDTNVLLRIVYKDDSLQAARAETTWRHAINSGGVFPTCTTLVELAWVLRVAAKFDRPAIASALRRLCDAQGVTIQDEPAVRRALAMYETGSADFSDFLILETAREAKALPVVTFDEKFARSEGVRQVVATT